MVAEAAHLNCRVRGASSAANASKHRTFLKELLREIFFQAIQAKSTKQPKPGNGICRSIRKGQNKKKTF